MPGGLELSSWEGCWSLGAVAGCSCRGGFSPCCPARCLLPHPSQASSLCSVGSALCFIAGFPRHVPQLLPRPGPFSKSRQDSVSPVVQTLGPTAVSARALRDGAKEGSPGSDGHCPPPQSWQASLGLLPEDGLSSECSEASIVGGSGVDRREPPASAKAPDKRAAGSGPPVSACKLAVVPPAPEDATKHEVSACLEEGRGV